MAAYQYCNNTNGQPQYDTAYSTSSYNPAIPTETYVEETYDSNGNKVVAERENYDGHGHSYGRYHRQWIWTGQQWISQPSALRRYLDCSAWQDSPRRVFPPCGTTYSGQHLRKGHSGSHGSGRTHCDRVRLFRKKREDGHSDSDHE